jgi:hypothetical protein
MQKNVPGYAPPWIRTVSVRAESSHREVRYALCEDKATLTWFANQRAVEYHVTLGTAAHPGRPSCLVLDIDPPTAGEFGKAVTAHAGKAREGPQPEPRHRGSAVPTGRRAPGSVPRDQVVVARALAPRTLPP